MTYYITGLHHEPSGNRTVKLRLADGRIVCDTVAALNGYGYWKNDLDWRYVSQTELEQLKAGARIPSWEPNEN